MVMKSNAKLMQDVDNYGALTVSLEKY